jgi:undecaprenyl-diphosphatase
MTNALDTYFYSHILLLRNPAFTPVMLFVTNLLSPTVLPFFAAILMGWFAKIKQWAAIYFCLISLVGGLILESALKIIFGRTRPPFGLVVERSFSFPSGHATMAAIFFLLLIYLFKDQFKNKINRIVFINVNVALIILVGFSRLYLGVHWFTDVLGGFVIGATWFFLIYSIFKQKIWKTKKP